MIVLGFNWIDVSLVVLVGISALIGFLRGFIKEGLSLLSWVLAFVLSVSFGPALSQYLVSYISSATVRHTASFVSIFLMVLIAGGMLSFLIKKLVDSTGFSIGDRFLGFCFGVLRGVALATLLLLMGVMVGLSAEPDWRVARLIPIFNPLVLWVKDLLPEPVNHPIKSTQKSAAFQQPKNDMGVTL